MFISWINQILAVLNKPEGKAVHAILHEIAQTYPQVSFASSVSKVVRCSFVNRFKVGVVSSLKYDRLNELNDYYN